MPGSFVVEDFIASSGVTHWYPVCSSLRTMLSLTVSTAKECSITVITSCLPVKESAVAYSNRWVCARSINASGFSMPVSSLVSLRAASAGDSLSSIPPLGYCKYDPTPSAIFPSPSISMPVSGVLQYTTVCDVLIVLFSVIF